jgi:hypothetical protein
MRHWMKLCESLADFKVDAYHGTTADFPAFDPSLTRDIGLHFGTAQQADRATRDYFGKPKDNANIIPVKLRLRNPLRVRDLFDTTRTRYIARAKKFCLETPGFHPNSEEHDAIFDTAKAADRARHKAGGDWGSLDSRKAAHQKPADDAAKAFWQAIQASAERQGYDGFIYKNRVEGKGDSYVVFDPRNVRAKHASFANPDSDRLLDCRLFESKLPTIDKWLAQAVLDAATRHGFDMSNWAAPSMWDAENGGEEAEMDEDELLVQNILASMRQMWTDQIRPAIKGDQLRVYRAVAVSSIYQLRSDALGKHWSTSRKHAFPYWATKGNRPHSGGQWLVVQALVDLKHVEWADTFALHIEGGEDEVELYAGTPVSVTGIEWASDHGPIEDTSGQELIGQTLTT